MPEPKKQETVPETATIEAHAGALGVPAWQFRGLKVREGWPEGKQVSRAEFAQLLDAWLSGPTVVPPDAPAQPTADEKSEQKADEVTK